MTTPIYKPIANIVQSMRQIRDEISNEIKDMFFAEERAFLYKLLQTDDQGVTPKKGIRKGKTAINTSI